MKYLNVTSAEFDKLGILTFKNGEKTITREELTLAFYNLAKHTGVSTKKTVSLAGYKDFSELDSAYQTSFAWAVANRVINKTSETIKPNDVVERARLAQMFYNFTKLAK